MRTASANLAMVRHVAERLGDLRERVVFLGGAATTLLITDQAAPEVRPTLDVDALLQNRSFWTLSLAIFLQTLPVRKELWSCSIE